MSVRLGMRCVNIFFPISYIRAESPKALHTYNPRPIYTPWRCTGTGRPERAGAPDPERSDRFLGRFRSSARTCAKILLRKNSGTFYHHIDSIYYCVYYTLD